MTEEKKKRGRPAAKKTVTKKTVKKTPKKTVKKTPKKMGAPTKYDPKYCTEIVEFMGSGKSLTQFAASIDVSKETVYAWIRDGDKPDFSDAFRLAKTKCEGKWHGKLEDFMENRNANAPLVKLYFANMFGWSDKVETNTTVSLADELKDIADK